MLRKVRARLEVGCSNSDLRKCAYLVKKKLYLDRIGARGGGRLARIFFVFYLIVFEVFSNSFIFYKIICRRS